MWRSTAAAVLLFVATGTSLEGDARRVELLTQWVAAVEQHEPGEADAAIAQAASWSREDLEALRPYTLLFAELAANRQPRRRLSDFDAVAALVAEVRAHGDPLRFLKRAVLLHTDVVVIAYGKLTLTTTLKPSVPGPFARSAGATTDVFATVPDGRLQGFELGNPHWDHARTILTLLTNEPFFADWYRSIAAHLAWTTYIGDLINHFEQALDGNPRDRWLVYGSACLQETLASPRTQTLVASTTLPKGLIFDGLTSTDRHLRRAEELFRRALAIEPSFPEAQIRLGRVMHQRGRHAEALAALDGVGIAGLARELAFFTHLFRADAARALGRTDDARASYTRAIGLFPTSHAARVGLAHLLREGGDRLAALAALQPSLALANDARERDDPWSLYWFCEGPYSETLLDRLREPFLMDPRP